MTVAREFAVQGSTCRLYHYFTSSGILADPTSITSVKIKDSDDAAVTTLTPVHVRTGVYYIDWSIDSSQEAGAYTDEWIVVGLTPTTQSGSIQVHDDEWDFITGEMSGVTSGNRSMVASLQLMLGMFGNIAVFDEEALLDAARTKAITTYRHWRYDREIYVRIGNTLQTAYYADYNRGEIHFNEAVDAGYPVLVRYHFSYFTPEKLEDILEWACGEFNLRKPVTSYTLTSLPSKFQQYVIMRAFVEAVNILRLDRLMWTSRLIYANPEEVEGVLSAKSAEIREMVNAWRKPRSVVSPMAITSASLKLNASVQAHTALWSSFGVWA